MIAVRNNSQEDLNYLVNFLNKNKNSKCCYEKKTFDAKANYKAIYTVLHDNDLVFKIDDNVVFISK